MPQRSHGRFTRVALIGLTLDLALGGAAHLCGRRLFLPPGSLEIALPGWQPTAVAFSPIHPVLAIGLRRPLPGSERTQGGVALVDARTGTIRQIVSDPPDGIAALAFSPDGAQLALATDSGQIFLQRSDGERRKALRGPAARALAFSPDSRWLAAAGPGGAQLLSLRQDPAHPLPGPTTAVAFSPDGRWLVVGAPAGGFRQTCRSEGRPAVVSPLADAAAFSPDGRFLALFQEDRIEMRTAGGMRIGPWERRFGVSGHHLEIEEAPGSAALWSQWMPDATAQGGTLAFSADGAWLVCGERNQVSFLGAADGEIRRRRFVPGFTGVLASAPDGGRVALCRPGSVVLWPEAFPR